MPAFNFHFLLSAAGLAEAQTLPGPTGTLAAGVAVQFVSGDAPTSIARCFAALEAHGGRLLAVGLRWDVRRPPQADAVAQWIEAIGQDCDLLLLELVSSDVHDKPSAPRALPIAAPLLHLVSKLASPRLRIALAPRPGAWLSDEHDAVRLAMRVNRGNVGVALNWSMGRDGQTPTADLLRLVEPKLMAVIFGPRKSLGTNTFEAPHTTEDFKALQRIGYRGPVFVRLEDEAT